MISAIEKHKNIFEKLILTGSITLDEVIENIWKESVKDIDPTKPIDPNFKIRMFEMFINSLPSIITEDIKYDPKTRIFILIRAKIN